MKNFFLILLLLAGTSIGFSQNQASSFTGSKSDQPRDPRSDLMNFVPNEVLVKFKDAVPVTAGARVKVAGVSSVDKILAAHGVTELEKLFPTEQKPARVRMMKSPQGKVIAIPRIDNIYRVNIPALKASGIQPTNIHSLIEELKALPEVEYAEPNYIYSIDNMKPTGPVLTANDVQKLQANSMQTAFTPNDPLYGQQWYIPAVKADSVWQQTTGDTTQVIAILDTGVDWTHPDLKNKIWKNPNPATTKTTDGVLNDIRGWDYINNDNDPMDDNSHGTHVAGIAAAETNNGIGIAGVCPKAKIMPIKVFQSSGRGDAATITKGIIYAATHGATVINMSFGTYARSLAMEDALANAYATCVLVAAAGNDGIAIESRLPPGRFYPAALSYVLGVIAPEAVFSNMDDNGPTFSTYDELNNYEMKAPGTNIISCIPGGNYRAYQGTSMAAPIISGALALYRKLIPAVNETNEFMWVKLIQATGQYLNINKALTIVPKPEIQFLNKVMVDTIGIDDKDGRVDAGETIQLWFRARNTGGQVDSVYWKIRLAEFEDPTTCQIVKSTSFFGSISPYATRTSENDPMKFIISKNVAHDRDIKFDLLSWYKGATDTLRQDITINVTNGVELSGVMDTTLTLTNDKLWIVNSSFKIGRNGILKINQGSNLILNKSIENSGKIYGYGTKESQITITGVGTITSASWNGKMNFKYTNFSGMTAPFCGDSLTFSNCIIEDISIEYSTNTNFGSLLCGNNINMEDDIIRNSRFGGLSYGSKVRLKKCNITNFMQDSYFVTSVYTQNVSILYNNFVNISNYKYLNYKIKELNHVIDINNYSGNENNIFGIGDYEYFFRGITGTDIVSLPNIYWGTTNLKTIKSMNYDFWMNPAYPMFNYNPIRSYPSDSAHTIVWKVLVNGKDAQDEVVEPVGVGKQRFDVYFNRPMDKTITPQISFGVRMPYSQQPVNEDGSWSADGRIYTAYKSIKLTTGDGLNRIRVFGAKGLNDWVIPTEDMRFNFLISAASSSSLEFMATAGLGKVKLEWNNSDLADGLGYNMYRMEHINDSTLTKPMLINQTLITDTLYTDFAVTPNKKYYYYYKILRTNMAETDSSKFVSAIPFTASKGDANGDLSVNVLDITSIVAYLLNNNPQPFIFEAADVNSDAAVNVLDIVGVVNKVLGPQKVRRVEMTKQADLYMKNDTLFADATVPVGGIQLDLKGISSTADIQKLQALEGFESGYNMNGDSLRLIYYSMSGKSIPAGQHIPLLKLKNGCTITNAVFGEPTGSPIHVNFILTRVGDIQNNMNQTVAELGQNYPNPVTGKTIIPIRIYEPVEEATLRIVNTIGQQVGVITLANPYIGEHLLPWTSGQNKGLLIYTLEIKNGTQRKICPLKKMIVQ